LLVPKNESKKGPRKRNALWPPSFPQLSSSCSFHASHEDRDGFVRHALFFGQSKTEELILIPKRVHIIYRVQVEVANHMNFFLP